MPSRTVVTIVNFEKRKVTYKCFTKICEAVAFMKTYTRGKGCFIYAERNNEVLAVKSDLAPMKVYERSETYDYETESFEYADNHSVLFTFVSSPSVPRFGSYASRSAREGLF